MSHQSLLPCSLKPPNQGHEQPRYVLASTARNDLKAELRSLSEKKKLRAGAGGAGETAQ